MTYLCRFLRKEHVGRAVCSRTMTAGMLAAVMAVMMVPLSSCSRHGGTETQVVRPVRYAVAAEASEGREKLFSGSSKSEQEAKLSFKVPGTIRRITVDVGDHVRKGQLIAELDDTDYRLKVQEAEAGFDRAKAAETNAKAVYERIQALYANGNVSRNDLDAARAAFESASSAMRGAGKQVEFGKSQLSYTRLEAPASGSIAVKLHEESENIAAGFPVFLLTAGTAMDVEISVPESMIGTIRKGLKAKIEFPAIPGRTYRGVVREVGSAAVGAFITFPVTVRLDTPGDEIKPGMAARVLIDIGGGRGKETGVIVPPQAVAEDRNGRFAFVVEKSDGDTGVAHRRTVKTGSLDDAGLLVTEGLGQGDIVVTAGISRIEDGMKVRLMKENEMLQRGASR